MENSVKIAVIGAGYWGKNLVRNFYNLNALVCICDRDGDALKVFEKDYPGVRVTDSIEGIMNSNSVDAVAIATPAETHYEIVRSALLSSKHVFVEKPLALSEEDGIELRELANKKNRILMVGHLLHYHPAVIKLKELVSSGELGRIQYIYSNRLNLGKIRREENILWSFAPHDISLILSLGGEMPDKVTAVGANYLHQKVADVTVSTLSFPSGIRAHIFVSWLHPYKEQRLVIVGDRKMAMFNDVEPVDKLILFPHRIEWKDHMPVPDKGEGESISFEKEEPLRAECMHFIECIQRGIRPRTDADEGISVLKVLQACQKSMENNGKPVVIDVTKRTKYGEDIFIHESAIVDPGCEIGKGTKIWHFSHIIKGSRIGESCNIGQNVMIGPNVRIGNRVKIQNNVSVYEGVTLEDGVFCGPSMVFTNVYNPRSYIPRKNELRTTLVKEGATLGANCTILCGHTIGRYAFIGAGAVVIDDVPDYALVVGNPAKIKGWMCRCGVRLHFKDGFAICDACGKKYTKNGNIVSERE